VAERRGAAAQNGRRGASIAILMSPSGESASSPQCGERVGRGIRNRIVARFIERLVLVSRWLLAPLYLGLALVLLLFIVKFFLDLAHLATTLIAGGDMHLTLAALTLLDIVLVASLIVMVMLSGYDNFVARIELGDDQHGLTRLTRLEVGSIKVRIVSSAAVISAIYLLEVLFTVDQFDAAKLLWMIALHLALVATAVLFALLDRLEKH
jgi:uncharacterized protein (TIGR00645 family)